MEILFLKSAILFLAFVSASYVIGRVLLKLIKFNDLPDFYLDFAVKSFFGCTAIVLFYSIYCSRGQTVNWVFVLLTACLILFDRAENTKKARFVKIKPPVFNHLFNLALGAAAMFSAKFYLYMDSNSPLRAVYDLDLIYFARVSKSLGENGQENNFHVLNDLMPHVYQGTRLYHFYDLWLTSFLGNFTDSSTYLVYIFVSTTYFSFLSFLCVCALLSRFKVKIGVGLSSFLITLFFGSIIFPGIGFLPKTEHIGSVISTLAGASKYGLKHAVIAFLLLLFANAVLKNRFALAFFALSSLAVVYAPTVLAVGGALVLLAVWLVYEKEYAKALQAVTFLTILCAGLSICEIIFPRSSVMNGVPQLYSFSYALTHLEIKDLRLMFSYLVIFHYRLFLVFLIPIFCVFVYQKTLRKFLRIKNLRTLLATFIFIHISGFAAFCLFVREIDAVELYANIGLDTAAIFFLTLLCAAFYLRKNKKLVFASVALIVFLSAFYNPHLRGANLSSYADNEYYSTILRRLNERPAANKIGIELRGKQDFQSIWTISTVYSNLGDRLFAANNDFVTVDLSDFEKEMPSDMERYAPENFDIYTKNNFYQNYLREKIREPNYLLKDLPLESFEHQLEFIRQNRVEYGFISPNYLHWEKIASFVESYTENTATKEKFVFFRRQL